MSREKRGFEVVDKEFRKYDGRLKIKLPQRKTLHSSGYDISTPVAITIPAGGEVLFYTEVKAYMQPDEWLAIYIRSSLGFKGLRLSNSVAVIDSDFTDNPDNDGNIGIKIKNTSNKMIKIKKGDRVAQGIFQKYLTVDGDHEVEKEERVAGVGSTDKGDE